MPTVTRANDSAEIKQHWDYRSYVQKSRRNLIIFFSAIFLLLFTMIFFPLGADQSFFQIGGEMIAKKGAVPYRDFIDHKPLLFYIYSLAVLLFGSHEWTIRVFDIVYDTVALFFFY